MRVVLDTNVFVSGLMLPASLPGRILAAANAGSFQLILSDPMLEEIGAALFYPKVRRRIKLADPELLWFVQALQFVAEVVDISATAVEVPGNRDDDAILATLVAGRADCLVTGDRALLALADRFPVITVAEFVTRHLS